MVKYKTDTSTFLADITPYVDSEGARNFNRISRELSIPYQTLRFRMLKLSRHGITVIPVVDAGKLRLERIRVSFRLSSDLKDFKRMFTVLNENAGLRYYSRGLVSQSFDCEFLIPRGESSELSTLLNSMEDQKILEGPRLRRILWKDYIMMKTDYFDYDSGEWDVDFSTLVGDPKTTTPSSQRPQEERFDYNDLLIIKSLELDPWVKSITLAKKIGTSDADIAYHLNRHVFDKKFISCFRMKWVGSKDAWAKHSILPLTLIFDHLSEESTRHAMSVITATPFVWSHMRSDDGMYLVELLIPTQHLAETMRYLSDNLRKLNLIPNIQLGDMSCTSNYTIPYQMYNKDHRAWNLKADKALGMILQVTKTRA